MVGDQWVGSPAGLGRFVSRDSGQMVHRVCMVVGCLSRVVARQHCLVILGCPACTFQVYNAVATWYNRVGWHVLPSAVQNSASGLWVSADISHAAACPSCTAWTDACTDGQTGVGAEH